jgi:tetratricopeptide (TPR) repeat protein
VQQARGTAERQLWPAAVTYQQDAVTLARQLVEQAPEDERRDAQIQLSVLLYNLAGYYGNANRHADAVTCLEKVVAIDAAIGHEDLADDRRALEAARQRAATQSSVPAVMDADIAAFLAQLPTAQREATAALLTQAKSELESLGPEDREQMLQAIAQFAALSPEEQAAFAEQNQFAQVEATLLGQLQQVVGDYTTGQLTGEDVQAVASSIDQTAAQLTQEDRLGVQRHELVSLLRCTAAFLRGESQPSVPVTYAQQWLQWTES